MKILTPEDINKEIEQNGTDLLSHKVPLDDILSAASAFTASTMGAAIAILAMQIMNAHLPDLERFTDKVAKVYFTHGWNCALSQIMKENLGVKIEQK